MSDDDNFQGDDFYWSDDSDSDEVQTEHDLQAQIENKGNTSEGEESEEDDEERSDESSDDEDTEIKGMGKSFSDAFSRIVAKDTKKNSVGALSPELSKRSSSDPQCLTGTTLPLQSPNCET